MIFDLDGVLVDSEPVHEAAFQAYVSGRGRPDLGEWYERTLGRRPEDFAPELADELGGGAENVIEGLDAELVRILGRAQLQPMPGAAAAVGRLSAGGRVLGLASSSARSFIDRALGDLGLGGSFAAIAAGDEAGRGKPDPELYLTAAERLDVAPATCVAIEDTPAGVEAAIAAGMTAIAVPNPPSKCCDLRHAHLVEADLGAAVRSILGLDGLEADKRLA